MGVFSECARFVIFTVNLLFMFMGFTLVCGGLVAQLMYKDVVSFVPGEIISLPIIAMTLGVSIFTMAFIAHCGALRKSTWMLRMFAYMLGLLFLLEITIGVLAVMYHSELEEGVETRMKDSMAFYGDEKHFPVTAAWDGLQSGLQCCGADSYTDWDAYMGHETYPASCYATADKLKVWSRGCLGVLVDDVRSQIVILGAVIVGIAVVQVIAMCFACGVVHAIKKERKDEMMEPLVR